MRNRLSADEWAELVREWETSGQSARAFAEARGVPETSLRWWKTEFPRRSKKAAAAAPSASSPVPRRRRRVRRSVKLARVVRAGEPIPHQEVSTRTAGIGIVVGHARIVIEHGFDATLLRAVIQALGGRA